MTTESAPDWSAWSREARQLMQERNNAWLSRYGLQDNPFRWNLEDATLVLERTDDEVVATMCLIGSVSSSSGTFLWSWANDDIPARAKEGVEKVRQFGEQNALTLLTTPEWTARRDQGLEMLAVAGRVLDAEGAWIAEHGDLELFFTLSNFRTQPPVSQPTA